MYLVKYLAHCGVCSRRKSVQFIKDGLVSVNGKVVTVPSTVVSGSDVVKFQKKVVKPQNYVHLLLNKPKDYLTTCSDERGRKTILDLLRPATNSRIYPVGRLDRISTGLLLCTNDGDLANKLSHPSSEVTKTYRVLLHKPFQKKDFQRLIEGFKLEDGFMKVDRCRYPDKRNMCDVIVEVHSGRNRIVRRIFEHCGYLVEKLDRVGYAGLTKTLPDGSSLERGTYRKLTEDEIAMLRKLF